MTCRNPYCPECAPDPPETDEPVDHTAGMCAAAAARALVRLADGRTARLYMWPGGRDKRRAYGRRAKVQLQSGAIVSLDPADVVRVEW